MMTCFDSITNNGRYHFAFADCVHDAKLKFLQYKPYFFQDFFEDDFEELTGDEQLRILDEHLFRDETPFKI